MSVVGDVAEQRDEVADRLYRIRHSAAHVMAQAVLELFPEAQLAIGPPIEDGFYYDFLLPRPLTPDDLSEIESRMRRIIAERHPFIRTWMDRDEAVAYYRARNQPFKVEILTDLPEEGLQDGRVSFYTQDTFTDLCKGPHVEHTGQIGAFKLMSVAGAYWRGDEKRPMLQRIYGTAWETEEQLAAYLHRLEEAARRDHRKLGRELELFTVSETVGPGLILWLPKGARVRSVMETYLRSLLDDYGYLPVYTPHLGRSTLWQTSGHLSFYRENMYPAMEVEEQEYFVKPMNCPFHIEVYRTTKRSYRELPLRLAEFGSVYRYERSGVLHGLLRVRGFTQDDAHIFCTPDQVDGEIRTLVDLAIRVLNDFGFEQVDFFVSTKPEKAVGRPEQWHLAETALKAALESRGLPYRVDEGGGAFYGPKIDFIVKDAIGRAWQLSTIQFDFNLPERFGLTYVGPDGQEHQPFMVHRALYGSFERFFAVLVEHYAGAFPAWLAPTQVAVIPIADRHHPYADEVVRQLRAAGLRVAVDASAERMQHKIREAQLQKIPFMLVIGDREVAEGTVAVRLRSGENLGAMPLAQFIAHAQETIAARR
ncbi:MAG: threonine--tRNA ligase [Chloroflexota bacterium]|nr:threonine--tRNA ligase [Dehalococcoidia bacterium]MDW8253327.1 threonine--tRNA ligase [Chloroflexota bacterium]